MSKQHIQDDDAARETTLAVGATTEEVARRFRVCGESIRRWARAGRIPAFRAGGQYRYDLAAVEEALRLRWVTDQEAA